MDLILNESLEVDKLKHLEHAEDHIIHGGHEGVQHALNNLDDVHNTLTGKSTKTKITTKYDGSPSVVFGHHPQSGKFFVASKSAFNANPKINYNHEDIQKNHGHAPGLVSKLSAALDHLPKVMPKSGGVYQGDFLYSKEDVFHDNDHLKFAPNTIVYGAHKNSEQGKKIAKSKIGFVTHTKYSGKTLDDMKAGFDVDHDKFNYQHPDVNLVNPEIKNHKGNYPPEAQREYVKHRSAAVKTHASIKPDVISSLSNHDAHIKPYINSTVRDETTPSHDGYHAHLNTVKEREVGKLKTDNARQKKSEHYDTLINHVNSNKDDFKKVFKLHNHIQKAKDTLVNAIGNPTEFTHTVGGKEVKPEGFVAIRNGRPTKLVDRAEFSRMNFANNRGKREQSPLHEAKENEVHHVFAFGRMNPPTIGHAVLVDKVKELAKTHNADHTVVLSHSHDPKKNPLSPEKKLAHAKKFFPNTNLKLSSKEAPSIIQQAKNLYQHGVTHLHMVAGADRVEEFRTLYNKYNGHPDQFNFKHVNVVSAGARDPDSDSVTGMSASKMRAHVSNNDFNSFRKGIPPHIGHEHAKQLFADIKDGMNTPSKLKESTIQALDKILETHISTVMDRATTRVRMRKFRTKIDTSRGIKLQRTASLEVLKRRATRNARNAMKNKLAGVRGNRKGYYSLSLSSRVAIDTMLKGRKQLIKQAALRMLPKVRQMDMSHRHFRTEEKVVDAKQRITPKELNKKKKFVYAIFDV